MPQEAPGELALAAGFGFSWLKGRLRVLPPARTVLFKESIWVASRGDTQHPSLHSQLRNRQHPAELAAPSPLLLRTPGRPQTNLTPHPQHQPAFCPLGEQGDSRG